MADPRFKGIEFKVGIFVLSALLLAVATITLVAFQKKVFTPKVEIKIFSETGVDLVKGMPILYSGFQIARVDTLQLQDDGKVHILAKIPTDYAKWIKSDSVVRLESKNIIGSASLIFSGGSGGAIKDGSSFNLMRTRGMDEIIEKAKPVMDDVKEIVKNVKIISDKLKDDNGSFNKFMTGLGDLGEDVSKKRGSLGFLTRSDYLEKKVKEISNNIIILQKNLNKISDGVSLTVDNVSVRAAESKETIEHINKLILESKELVTNINKSIDDIKPAIKNVNKISSDISDATDNISMIKKEAESVVNTSSRVLMNLEEKWPFSANGEKSDGKVDIP